MYISHSNVNPDEMDDHTAAACAADRIRHMAEEILISESGKMIFLVELLDNIRAEGHRALVFSQSRKMLDIIQKVITARVCRNNLAISPRLFYPLY